MRKLNKEFGTKTIEKTNEGNTLEELTDNTASGGGEHNTSSILDNTKTNDITAVTNEASLETNETNSSSSVTNNLSATSTNQNKIELSQNIYKELRDERTTSSDSSSTDFTPVEPESTTATLRSTEKFITPISPGDQSSKNSQEFSSESVTVTGQQLSNRYVSISDPFF